MAVELAGGYMDDRGLQARRVRVSSLRTPVRIGVAQHTRLYQGRWISAVILFSTMLPKFCETCRRASQASVVVVRDHDPCSKHLWPSTLCFPRSFEVRSPRNSGAVFQRFQRPNESPKYSGCFNERLQVGTLLFRIFCMSAVSLYRGTTSQPSCHVGPSMW